MLSAGAGLLVLSGSCLSISSMTMVALVPDGPVAKVDGAVRRLTMPIIVKARSQALEEKALRRPTESVDLQRSGVTLTAVASCAITLEVSGLSRQRRIRFRPSDALPVAA